jgi:ParB-like chromosome segregation protein Spo0J
VAAADKPVMVKLDRIRENPWNPNRMDEVTMRAAIENVKRFGFNGAVLVRKLDDDLFEVVDGAHRYRAAKAVGLTEIPVIVREFTDAEAKAQTIAMNEIRGEMDAADVARLVREIDEGGIGRDDLVQFSGLTAESLDALEATLTSEDAGATGSSSGSASDGSGAQDQSGDVKDGYHVIVECADEQSQLALVERLEAEGLNCRMVIS